MVGPCVYPETSFLLELMTPTSLECLELGIPYSHLGTPLPIRAWEFKCPGPLCPTSTQV